MTKTWAILQHVKWEGPGLIGEEMDACGIAYHIHRLDEGAAVPASDRFAGLVVMGGTMGVYEADRFPFLGPEIALLAACVAQDKPVLGICLGAQLLAAALGAPVSRGPVFETGEGDVALTEEGQRDPVLGGDGSTALPVVHWHQDTFPLPPGATWLARSDLYPQQAFRMGARAYGLQFHPEVNAALAAAWRPRLPAGIALRDRHVQRVEAAGRRLLRRFLGTA